MNWLTLALCSALFAGLTAVLAKAGVSQISSNLATLVRTGVVLIFATGIVLARGEIKGITALQRRDWLFLIASGIATGLSWLCYFAALKQGEVSRVAPIDKLSFLIAMTLGVLFFHEKATRLTWLGAALIGVGVLLTLPSVQESIRGVFAAK